MISNNLSVERYRTKSKLNVGCAKELGINFKRGVERHIKPIIKNKFMRMVDKTSTRSRWLKDDIKENIEFLKTIKSYKGTRHKNGYPVRGQRTHTNGKAKNIKKFNKKKKLHQKAK